MNKEQLTLEEIDALILDFDGVLTDNKVWINEDGQEWVSCNRSDGLAFDVAKKLGLKTFIISTEKNQVVTKRAMKLGVPVVQGVSNKAKALQELSSSHDLDLSRTIFIGNDLNDFEAIKLCGISACPNDSHNKIKKEATFILESRGGEGVVREFLEQVLDINFLEIINK